MARNQQSKSGRKPKTGTLGQREFRDAVNARLAADGLLTDQKAQNQNFIRKSRWQKRKSN